MNNSAHSVLLSAIVPARNEEAAIAACLQSLAIQPEIGEVLVVDDQSSDSTAAVVTAEMQGLPQVRLLKTHELPSGWVGKNYAVWLGACEAKGEWLLLTDADAVHQPGAAAKALAIAARENAALVSFSPEQVMKTWYEKALIPYVYCRLADKFSYKQVNDPENSAAAANGQFLLIRTDVYRAVGGHAAVAGDILEDVGLAKKVKSAGYSIWFGSGKGIVRVRMYRSFHAMWEGWKKNLYLLMGSHPRAIAGELLRAVTPALAVIAIALLLGTQTRSALSAILAMLASVIAICISYARRLLHNQFRSGLAWYAIPGELLFAGVLWASYRSHRRGRLQWKGREYPAGTPGASK